MSLASFGSKVEKFLADNSPTILTAVGVTGTVTTAYLTGKASIRAYQLIEEDERLHGVSDEKAQLLKDRTRLVWKLYIPPVAVGAVTVASIIGSNRIGTRRSAALAAAYSLSEKAFVEYKDKVVDVIGEKNEQKIKDEVAKDRLARAPISEREVIIAGSGDVLCFDTFTARYFTSNMEALNKAQNEINYQILNNMYASLTDFYNKIGLPATSFSEEVGWNTDKLLELEFSTLLSEDGRPCISVGFLVAPIRDYHRVH